MNQASADFMLHREGLTTFALSIVKNDEDAQDVVQEVFTEIIENPKDQLTRSYLFQAVRHRSLNKLRSKNRYNQAIEKFGQFVKDVLLDSSTETSSVMELVNQLPQDQKEILVLRIKAELKISEIASVLNIPEGTVKSRLNKAMTTLKRRVTRSPI